jgi:hypothetical protein
MVTVEELRICVALGQPGDAGSLPSDGAFKGGKAKNLELQFVTQVSLLRREWPHILCIIMTKNNLLCEEELQLDISNLEAAP